MNPGRFSTIVLRAPLIAGGDFILVVDGHKVNNVIEWSLTGGVDETTKLEYTTHCETSVVVAHAEVEDVTANKNDWGNSRVTFSSDFGRKND